MNMLQFIFLSLRLDGFTSWSWEVVFVPLWIVLCLSLVGVLYTIIFAGILLRTPQVNAEQRRSWFNSALAYTFLVVPILVFQVSLFYVFNIIYGVLTKYGVLQGFQSGHHIMLVVFTPYCRRLVVIENGQSEFMQMTQILLSHVIA